MKTAVQLQAEPRESYGKGSTRALRRVGKVPAQIYAGGKAPISISVPEKDLWQAYNHRGFFSKIVSIQVGKDSFNALPKEVNLHPVTDRIEHIDFLKVDAGTKIRVQVPVRFLNVEKSAGLKRGGVLNIVRHEVELVCSPDAIPTQIEIDILNTNIGESIHISHVKLPDGVTPSIKDRDFTIATIAGRAAKDDADDSAAPTATAEVPAIAQKKED